MYYRPLPNGLYIGLSKIEGQGVYTSKELLRGCKLGESHYRIDVSGVNSINEEENENIIIRTPLGGFMNHNVKPNCHRSQIRIKPGIDKWVITVVEDINPGEELTLKYEFYDPEKPI
jgi:SET domain-containing protein|tara:strand:- start:54 stop:404 length:351 start_codon:yes stop_codon:yes gene_type:complete